MALNECDEPVTVGHDRCEEAGDVVISAERPLLDPRLEIGKT
jgi:hypothetical protein